MGFLRNTQESLSNKLPSFLTTGWKSDCYMMISSGGDVSDASESATGDDRMTRESGSGGETSRQGLDGPIIVEEDTPVSSTGVTHNTPNPYGTHVYPDEYLMKNVYPATEGNTLKFGYYCKYNPESRSGSFRCVRHTANPKVMRPGFPAWEACKELESMLDTILTYFNETLEDPWSLDMLEREKPSFVGSVRTAAKYVQEWHDCVKIETYVMDELPHISEITRPTESPGLHILSDPITSENENAR